MFTAALVTIANNQGIYKDVYTYTIEYYSATKRTKWCHLQWHGCPRDYHTEWSKSDTERQILYDFHYIWNLKKKDTKELIYKTELESQA